MVVWICQICPSCILGAWRKAIQLTERQPSPKARSRCEALKIPVGQASPEGQIKKPPRKSMQFRSDGLGGLNPPPGYPQWLGWGDEMDAPPERNRGGERLGSAVYRLDSSVLEKPKMAPGEVNHQPCSKDCWCSVEHLGHLSRMKVAQRGGGVEDQGVPGTAPASFPVCFLFLSKPSAKSQFPRAASHWRNTVGEQLYIISNKYVTPPIN